MPNYGLPYQGSKNKIATKIANLLPPAQNFYDLFAGGCAVTHAALLYDKWQNYYINDINDIPQLFADAVAGKYNDETRWISHTDFDMLKDSDPYVRVCWSFGNNCKHYLYNPDLEIYKHDLHEAVVNRNYEPLKLHFGIDLSYLDCVCDIEGRRKVSTNFLNRHDADIRRLWLKWAEQERNTPMANNERTKASKLLNIVRFSELQHNESLQRLQRLQSLQSLQRLQRLQSLQSNYYDVPIKPNSVIYCDIPYINTAGYNNSDFDHARFYDWCKQQTEPLFISEYTMPEKDFVCIKEYKLVRKLSQNKVNYITERIFRPKHQL